jgi:transposase InsO family protein
LRDESLSRRYRFVSHHSSPDLPAKQRHPVTRLCGAADVERGGYYAWRPPDPPRAAKSSADQALTCRIRKIHQDSRCTYGAKRVAQDPADGADGQPSKVANHKKVARLMRQHHIAGRHLRRRRALTRQDKAAAPVPNPLRRDFAASAPNLKWCGDITYIPVGESGFIYPATVIGLFSGRLVG